MSDLQKKIDRNVIERLRAFQSPPQMVGTIMVMTMVLIGRPEFAHFVHSAGTKTEKRGTDGGSLSFSDDVSRASSAATRRTKELRAKSSHSNIGKNLVIKY